MFDRNWTAVMPANAGPDAIVLQNVNLPGGRPNLELCAWTGSLQGSNVYLFEGDVSVTDAQNRIASEGALDVLMVIPRGGEGRIRIAPDMTQRLTVFFDETSQTPQAVTIRIYELGA